jgi:hypothetical protein
MASVTAAAAIILGGGIALALSLGSGTGIDDQHTSGQHSGYDPSYNGKNLPRNRKWLRHVLPGNWLMIPGEVARESGMMSPTIPI